MRKGKIATAFVGTCLLLFIIVLPVGATNASINLQPKLGSLEGLSTTLTGVRPPTIDEPTWLQEQKKAQVVTYDVATRGVITASLADFKTEANQTLNDTRGWAAMGVRFQEVASSGMFTLVLAEGPEVPSFSPGCDAQYSCNVGRYVIINQDRWLYATSPWNQAGKSLRDYRHLVINHETGHWLGHPDYNTCAGPGQSAPVMAQQSLYLGGCAFNPWPLASEQWSTTLGVTI